MAQRLLTLTREMLELARRQDWAGLAQRELERQDVARELFASPVPREDASTVADCVRQVLDLDQELITLSEAGREDAARAMQEVRTGREAAKAYRRFSR